MNPLQNWWPLVLVGCGLLGLLAWTLAPDPPSNGAEETVGVFGLSPGSAPGAPAAEMTERFRGWLDRYATCQEDAGRDLLYYYYVPQTAQGDILSTAVTAFAILDYLDSGEIGRAEAAGRALSRCRDDDGSPLTRGAFPNALARGGRHWFTSDYFCSGDNLLVMEAFLRLHDATGDAHYLDVAVGIGEWLLRVPCSGRAYGMWLEDHRAPLNYVSRDGTFDNTIRPDQLLPWLAALEHLSEATGRREFRDAMDRAYLFLLRGVSEGGVVYSLYNPQYPPVAYDRANWEWHDGDTVFADELLRSAIGLYRAGAEEAARRILDFIRPDRGAVYACLDPTTGGAKFDASTPPYFDVVASSLYAKLASLFDEPTEPGRETWTFLGAIQSENGGWYWGVSTDDLRPVEPRQAAFVGLWTTAGFVGRTGCARVALGAGGKTGVPADGGEADGGAEISLLQRVGADR